MKITSHELSYSLGQILHIGNNWYEVTKIEDYTGGQLITTVKYD